MPPPFAIARPPTTNLLLLLVLTILAPAIARARLTETEAQLIKRFGKVDYRSVQNTSFEGRMYQVGPLLQFHSEQWTIQALMIDDRCARITYSKVGSWSEEQIIGLLDRNGGYPTFKEEDLHFGKSIRKWKGSDGVMAKFQVNQLELTHPLYDRRLALLKAKAEAESKRAPKF